MSNASPADTRFWDVYSRTYDSINLSIPYRQHMQMLADAVKPAEGLRVLDLGCATGNLEREILHRRTGCSIVGVDYSPAMIARATKKCRRGDGISFIQADLSSPLPFEDDAFDVVVMNNVLYAFDTPGGLVAEIARVLAPGGRLVLSDPKPGTKMGLVVAQHFAELRKRPLPGMLAGYATTYVTLPLLGLPPMLLSLLFINRTERAGRYRFRSEEEIRGLLGGLDGVVITSCYADQSWLVEASKGA